MSRNAGRIGVLIVGEIKMRQFQSEGKVVLFAQVNRFSLTNDALAQNLPPQLGDCNLVEFRVYPIIRKNPFLLLPCLFGVAIYYGLKPFAHRGELPEKMIKTPVFFGLASWMIRRRANRIKNLAAIFQTQGLFNAKVDGIPLVIYTDNTILNKINARSKDAPRSPILDLERRLYDSADTITVAAHHVSDSLVEDYEISPDRIAVVLIGANAPLAPPSPPDRYESRSIVFIGIDWVRKGGPELVKAFLDVLPRFPDAKLTIIGCEPPVSHPNIDIKGRIPPEEVSILLARNAIFCMPSHVEPFGIAVIEAALAGLPVVGTATGGLLESVLPEKTGLLIEPGNVEQLREALERLLESPDLCRKLGEAGRERAKQFNWVDVSAKIAGYLKPGNALH